VHAFVPGGGPSLNRPNQWKVARPPARKTQHRFWLVDADNLRLAFRTAFLAGLRRLQARGKLKLDGEYSPQQEAAAFEDWLQPFENVKWGTCIQAPPTPDTTPDQVLKYLARYMTGGPISDRRLVRHEHGHVTFRARTGKQPGGSDEPEQARSPAAATRPKKSASPVLSSSAAGPCTFFRKATPRRVASAATATDIANAT